MANVPFGGTIISGGAFPTVDGNSQKIPNVANPTLAQDAATKNYVDSTPVQGSDHHQLVNLNTSDDHPRYVQGAGRSGGQTVVGDTAAGNLTIAANATSTDGTIIVRTGDATKPLGFMGADVDGFGTAGFAFDKRFGGLNNGVGFVAAAQTVAGQKGVAFQLTAGAGADSDGVLVGQSGGAAIWGGGVGGGGTALLAAGRGGNVSIAPNRGGPANGGPGGDGGSSKILFGLATGSGINGRIDIGIAQGPNHVSAVNIGSTSGPVKVLGTLSAATSATSPIIQGSVTTGQSLTLRANAVDAAPVAALNPALGLTLNSDIAFDNSVDVTLYIQDATAGASKTIGIAGQTGAAGQAGGSVAMDGGSPGAGNNTYGSAAISGSLVSINGSDAAFPGNILIGTALESGSVQIGRVGLLTEITGDAQHNGDVIPNADGSHNVGLTGSRWLSLHAITTISNAFQREASGTLLVGTTSNSTSVTVGSISSTLSKVSGNTVTIDAQGGTPAIEMRVGGLLDLGISNSHAVTIGNRLITGSAVTVELEAGGARDFSVTNSSGTKALYVVGSSGDTKIQANGGSICWLGTGNEAVAVMHATVAQLGLSNDSTSHIVLTEASTVDIEAQTDLTLRAGIASAGDITATPGSSRKWKVVGNSSYSGFQDIIASAAPASPAASTIRQYVKLNAGVLEFHLVYPDGTDHIIDSH